MISGDDDKSFISLLFLLPLSLFSRIHFSPNFSLSFSSFLFSQRISSVSLPIFFFLFFSLFSPICHSLPSSFLLPSFFSFNFSASLSLPSLHSLFSLCILKRQDTHIYVHFPPNTYLHSSKFFSLAYLDSKLCQVGFSSTLGVSKM